MYTETGSIRRTRDGKEKSWVSEAKIHGPHKELYEKTLH